MCDKRAGAQGAGGQRIYSRRMGRPPRSIVASLYHIGSHGSDHRPLFIDDDDREEFVGRISATFCRLAIRIVSYVLMTNHYHAIVYTPDARLSRALQGLHGGYSLKHNARFGRKAHLFRAHCFVRQIRSASHLQWCARYLAHNPVEAGVVLDPLDWPSSSVAIHVGREPPPGWLDERPLRDAFGGDGRWRARYRAHIAVENEKDPPERAFRVAGAGFEPATSGL
jgi:REP element-mobilizing transposase RayT